MKVEELDVVDVVFNFGRVMCKLGLAGSVVTKRSKASSGRLIVRKIDILDEPGGLTYSNVGKPPRKPPVT